MKSITTFLVAVPALALCASATAQSTRSDADSQTEPSSHMAAPDNTKSNREDPSNRTATADQQTNNGADRDLAKQIRRSVMADRNLSTYAHNVKIVAENGTVTLNGVVRSADEKAQIAEKAASIAGERHVVNELKVTPAK